ncbi:MAG: hypothetical protein AAGF01_17365 [Cyanobacteria bacterium P01_G01_bin.38]
MGNDDVLILTIYALVVFYVLYKMAVNYEELQEDQINLALDTDRLIQEVTSQLSYVPNRALNASIGDNKYEVEFFKTLGIKRSFYYELVLEIPSKLETPSELEIPSELDFELDSDSNEKRWPRNLIQITVLPQGKRPIGPEIRFLNIQIRNNTAEHQVFVDWDSSSLTYRSPQAQRVIRSVPGNAVDLLQQQVYSIINPKQEFSANITTERCFEFNPENQRLEITTALINVQQLAEFLLEDIKKGEKKNGGKQKNNLSDKLLTRPLYSLSLSIGIKRPTEKDTSITQLLIPFGFKVSLLPGEIAFLPLRWLLNSLRKQVDSVNKAVVGSSAHSRR